MKHFLFAILFLFSAVISNAQTPLGRDINKTIDIYERQSPQDAYKYWEENEHRHRADSLYAFANAYIGETFMYDGHMKESEILFNRAWSSINSMQSDDPWWWRQRGNIANKYALFNLQIHDYNQAQNYAVDAKIAFEACLMRGIDYAEALVHLAHADINIGWHVFARTFSNQAMFYALRLLNNDETDVEDVERALYVIRECALLEYYIGDANMAIDALEALDKLYQQFNIEDYGGIATYLGLAYVNNKDYSKAIDCLQPCYEQFTRPDARIKSGLGLLFAKYKLGHKDVLKIAYDIAILQNEEISKMFSFMSEHEKEKWLTNNENLVIPLVNFILIKSNINGVNNLIANNEIFAKGLLLRASNQLKSEVLKSNDPEIIAKYYSLEGLKYKWTHITDREEQFQLENQISTIEKELQSRLNTNIADVASWRDVALALTENEAAIEFVRYDFKDEYKDAEYYAIIVQKEYGEPRIIYLFNESSLKPILANNANKPVYKYVTDLYSAVSSQSKGKDLYELVWSKVEKEVKGCKTIYYSPAGLLNTISLQAISNGKSYLGEKYTMHLVSSIGSVPQIKAETAEIGAKAVVYGGIQYDVEESMMIQESHSYMPTNPLTWDTSFGETRRGWKYLPGTDKEAKSISSMFTNHNINVKLILGTSANEESFKALSGKGFNAIHIATHGFFLSDNAELKKNAFINPTMSDKIGFVDPMMRSGLLFAGGNRAWTGKRHINGIEDGILTAKEISTLDFSSVDLVVLSACQTGLGDVKANEGVYGLQRAFKLAGVQTIIMSLWEVDDHATSIMMSVFYEKYLEGRSKDDAFKYAIDTVRNYEVDGKHPFISPYYWAGFVMMD